MNLENLYIGFDRDGTLELPDVPTPEKLSEQFAELQARGATLFIASGKSHLQLQTICREIGLIPWLIAAENGGHIIIPKDNFEWVDNRHPDLAYFLKAVETLPLPPHVHESKRLIWSKGFGAQALYAADLLKDFIALQKLQLDVFTYPWGAGGVDVVPKGVDKISLLQHIPKQAIIHYFGDSENDLALMQDARVIPHTVSNAKTAIKDCVKERGGIISESLAGQGVSNILEQLFLK